MLKLGLCLGLTVVIGLTIFLLSNRYLEQKKFVLGSTSTSTHLPYSTSTPIFSPKTYVETDPIVNCGPGVNSKQYIRDRTSNCKNYVDCGLNNNTVWVLMLKSECDKKHVNSQITVNNNGATYSPCTVCWKYAGCLTYTTFSPEECARRQNEANLNTSIASTPIPNNGNTTIIVVATPTPTTVQHDQAAIDRCKAQVREETTNLINGCYVKYQDSSAEACARGIQDQQAQKITACESL